MTGRPDEDALIARFFAPLATSAGADGLRDDAAVIEPPPGFDLVVTADALVAGVHFFPDDPPDLIARKALRVNLSDLAAKGATPFGYMLTIALPEKWTVSWLEGFAAGLAADQAAFAISLLGGDTTATPGPLTLSITAFGLVARGRIVRRFGAAAGDIVAVTGTIGDAALGCDLRYRTEAADRLPPDTIAFLSRRYLLPEPRIALAPVIERLASAAMDISDGLAGDLVKLCTVSGVGARVAVEAVPMSDAGKLAVSTNPRALQVALTGGDDYEILACFAPDAFAVAADRARVVGVPLTAIGVVTGEGGAVLTQRGKALLFDAASYRHFR